MSDYGHPLRFGTFVTPLAEDPAATVARARLAEDLGLDLVTFQDHPYQPRFLDTWTLLSYVASATERIHVAPNVVNVPMRPPAVLARAAASLDLLSGGRVDLALGAGAFWDAMEGMGARRLSAGESVDALEEALAVVRALWGQGDAPAGVRGGVRVPGAHHRLDGAEPGPATARRIPVWLGALGPRMLRLTGTAADGWLPSLGRVGLDGLRAGNAAIDDAATAAGRDPREITRLLNVSGTFADAPTDPDGARGPDLAGPPEAWVERLLPLYRAARDHGVFLNLDMEEYRDLALTTEVFRAVLSRDEFRDLQAGIVLQAYLPDALGALDDLTAFAAERVAAGGAPVKVRLVKGANLAMEAVEAELHGWPQAPYPTKPDVDANYVRLLDHALRAPRTDAVRIGVASHNLFHVALAVLLGRARGVSAAVDVEMLQGMAPGEARAVRDEVGRHGGRVVLYTPVVRDEDFDVAISYLVRRLEENAAEQNFLHAMFAGDGRTAMERQEDAFRASVRHGIEYAADDVAPRRRARADVDAPVAAGPGVARQYPAEVTREPGFANAADTDPAVAAHRAWARRVTGPDSGYVPVRTPELASTVEVDDVVARAGRATAAWAQVVPAARGRVLRAVARRLEEARTDLVAAMVHEPGKTVAEADPEVSEAVDFARYYADRADDLEPGTVPGARFEPDGVTLVTPPWNFPVAIPVGGVLAALAAGSAVIAKPAPPTPRCLEVAVEAVHAGLRDAAEADPDGLRAFADAGVEVTDVVQYVRVPDDDRGRHLVTHDGVARVVLTGSIETAQLFARWRPERPVLAETSGKNALVVTPSADLDLAVADVVRSAFGHAGQKCSAASLLILVGSAGDPRTETGRRVRRQLVDAVRSLAVGPATDLSTTMGPLTEPASGKLLRALTTLEEGESWLVEPRCLDGGPDGAGRLWTPGLKEGVRPGSAFHLTEYFGPVLGIMTAATLDEAVALQNAVPFGLTGGIHSLDDDEVRRWLDAVEVGNAYVNRHITGAVVQRQSFGGWKQSAVGPGAKAGGPNYVAQLGRWRDDAAVPARDAAPQEWLAWAKADDVRWWEQEFSREHDPSGLHAESNVFRYRPVDDAEAGDHEQRAGRRGEQAAERVEAGVRDVLGEAREGARGERE
uniref:proline dehydrogenase family protein n=1 Tax=Cellulosimicrobium cellulans TaxID=1710 RepID=UPI000AD989A9